MLMERRRPFTALKANDFLQPKGDVGFPRRLNGVEFGGDVTPEFRRCGFDPDRGPNRKEEDPSPSSRCPSERERGRSVRLDP